MSNLKAQIISSGDQRNAERYATQDKAKALVPGAESASCVVLDISETGARIELSNETVQLPANLKIYIAERDLIADCKVVWRRGKEFGVTFESTAIL